MTAVGAVWTVMERLELLCSGDRLTGSYRETVESLRTKLAIIQNLMIKNVNDDGNSFDGSTNLDQEAIQLAYDIENAVESLYLQLQTQTQMQEDQPSKRKHFPTLIGRSRSSKLSDKSTSPRDSFQILNRRIDDLRIVLCPNDADVPQLTAGDEDVATGFMSDVYEPSQTIVGMQDDFEQLQHRLVNDDDDSYRSISIFGMGGIGKTTLARDLFDSSPVRMKFDARAWVQIGQKFQARDMAASILLQLSSSESRKEEVQAMETTELMVRLYKEQHGRRCILVLDDVWSLEVWDTIRFAIAPDFGSRIVITTRLMDVAEVSNGHIHKMKLLNDKHSWELLRAQLSVQDLVVIGGKQQKEIQKIVMEVDRRCRGLPLAIIVFGGIVRENFLDWSETLQNLGAEERGEYHEELQKILSLSYKKLPLLLKTCFLYMGLFPDDQAIPVEKLYQMWMAEGLISTRVQGDKSRRDVAEHYLHALVQRRLVMLQREDLAGAVEVKSCELHDLIHDSCKIEGRKNRFSIRRISMDLDNPSSNGSLTTLEPKQIRSLVFSESDVSSSGFSLNMPTEVADFKEFQGARVLDFDGVDFRRRKLPKGIENLVYLRYLSFRGCNLEVLPESFTKFHFLETLDLLVKSSCTMIISDILSTMSCLLHLYFPVSYRSADKDNKLRLGGLTRLETLENFHADVCDANDLQLLQRLQNFKGTSDGNNDDVEKMIKLINNAHLRNSSLTLRNYDCYSKERLKIVTDLLTSGSLQALDIEGHLGKLPSSVKFGAHITEMIFNGSQFEDDPMPILGKHPLLRSLVLCNDAYVGNKMVCAEEDFPELRFLKLSKLLTLAELIVDSGAMLCLSCITIERCRKLKTLPSELMEISTLQEVKIGQMSEEFLEHVSEMAEEQRSSGSEVVVRHLI